MADSCDAKNSKIARLLNNQVMPYGNSNQKSLANPSKYFPDGYPSKYMTARSIKVHSPMLEQEKE